jgi:Protein of unknown function (DUF3574)
VPAHACTKEARVKFLQQISSAVPRIARPALLVALVGLALGIAVGARLAKSDAGATCPPSAEAMARLELLFGTARPQGPPITDKEWASFLDAEVSPRFPAGFTVLRGPGQWRGSDGLLTKEQSNILVIWHKPAQGTEAAIETIRSAYKQRFDQENVMRVDSVSCVSF